MEIFKVLRIIEIALFWALWFAAAVLNIMLMVMFNRHPEIRTPENVLIINLCVADLAYLLSLLKNLLNPLIDCEKTVCLGLSFWRSFILALTAYSVVAISIQRYRGIIKFENRLLEDETNYKKPIRIVMGVWIFAILLAALELLISNYNSLYCILDIDKSGYRMVLYGFVPTIIVSYCYGVASCKIRRSAKNIPGIECEALAELRERRKRSARIILNLTASFLFTYVPYLSCMFMLTFPSGYSWLNLLYLLLVELTSVLNPFYNPIALCVASLQFKELYKRYCCCCCCCCRRQRHDFTSSSIANEQGTNVKEQESQA